MGLTPSCRRDAVGWSITSPFPMHSEFERSGSRQSAVSPPLCLTERRLGTLAIVDSIPPNIERAMTGVVPFWQGPVLGPRIIEARNGALVIRIPHVAEFCVNFNSHHMNAKNGHTLGEAWMREWQLFDQQMESVKTSPAWCNLKARTTKRIPTVLNLPWWLDLV